MRRKTARQYEELFEELMEYTDFKNAEEVTSIKDFAKQLKEGAESRGVEKPNKFFSKKFLHEMQNARFRISGKPIVKKRKVKSKRQQVLESKKVFKTYKQAQKEGLTAINPKAQAVFKTLIVTKKGVKRTRYRDSRGRWAKAPTIPEE